MAYNFLRKARTIQNSDLCFYDSVDAFSTAFKTNGSVEGWDEYYNVYFYGSWGGVLFGSSYSSSCYIGRSSDFIPINAEDYYYVKIMMKVIDNNPDAAVETLTTGKLRWTTIADSNWSSGKEQEFDITADNEWHLYTINVGPSKKWVGEITNIRVYPFINGREDDQFSIKYVRIGSLDNYVCTNTSCDYYQYYEHPCPGAGSKASCEAGKSFDLYTTVSGVSEILKVDIDGYGEAQFSLGDNKNLTGVEMSKVINNKLASLDIGGYCYSSVFYSDNDKIKILSGTVGTDSSVSVLHSTAAEILGFFESTVDVSVTSNGTDYASGFDYKSTRLLTAVEINELINEDKTTTAYKHTADNYSVEAGRADYNEIVDAVSTDDTSGAEDNSLSNRNRTLVDWSHPFNNNGRVTNIKIYGRIYDNAKVKICRPRLDGTLKVIHSLDFPDQVSGGLYTRTHIVYKIECDVLVSKGDVLAVYDADLSVDASISAKPDVTFSQVSGDVAGVFDPGAVYSYGIGGFAIFAYGDRMQTNTVLDIDLGDRLNIENVNVYGEEESEYFDFNVVACLDVNWQVDLHGGTHKHTYSPLGTYFVTDTHTNLYYGKECLEDLIVTADDGIAGETWGKDSNGIWTSGQHSYFYVNGDAEWLYPEEYNVTANTHDYEHDPLTFSLRFPADKSIDIHKCIMYFKEQPNFKDIALYYYLGDESIGGNYLDARHTLVSSFNNILLDGVVYDESNNEDIKDYIFENPCSATVLYEDDGITIENLSTLMASLAAEWQIIEHNFDPVTCYGFNIRCNHHKSTKVTELEVYTKIQSEPSLIDNITLLYSAYGEVWKTASFEKDIYGNVSAFIGGAPRYFSMELESTNTFTLNEIDFEVGDQVKMLDCSNEVLLNNSKRNTVNEAQKIDITNTYDSSFDLVVDLPKNTNSSSGLIFHSKLAEIEDLETPDTGPTCVLHKSEDYSITQTNRLCATNVPCYGLKNLADGKEAYYNLNNITWESFGTVSSGVSVDFCNTDYINTEKYELSFSPISSKYWKIQGIDVDSVLVIRDVEVYYGQDKVDIVEIATGSYTGVLKQQDTYTSDGTYLKDVDTTVFYDDFEDDVYSHWVGWCTVGSNCSLLETGGMFYLNTGASSGVTAYTLLDSAVNDFRFNLKYATTFDGNSESWTRFYFQDSVGTNIFYVYIKPVGGLLEVYDHTDTKIFDVSGLSYLQYSDYDNVLDIRRAGTYISVYCNGTHACYVNTGVSTDVERVQLEVTVNGVSSRHSGLRLIDLKIDVPTMLASNSTFGIKTRYSDPIDKIKFIADTGTITDLDLYTSNNNTNNYAYYASTITTSSSNHSIRFVFNMVNRHSLDRIRNYGFMSNKLFLSTTQNVDYSNSTTDDVEEVSFDNSTLVDVKWLRVSLSCSDSTTRCLDKIGLYPNIATPYCLGSGYNTAWEDLGTILSDYPFVRNLAYGAEIEANTYFNDSYPENVVNGNTFSSEMLDAWGFEDTGTDPYVDILFDSLYYIDKVVVYHSYSDADTDFMNNDYTLSVSTTSSGENFVSVSSITGNTLFSPEHYLTPVEARRLRLTVNSYTSNELDLGGGTTFSGGFIREIQAFNYVEPTYISSEAYPIIAMNLLDKFTIRGHELINKDVNDSATGWDNSDSFFVYSDSIHDNPKLVSFNSNGSTATIYSSAADSGDMEGYEEYEFTDRIYLEAGRYNLTWQAYNPDLENEISIRFDSTSVVDSFATSLGSGWADQSGVVELKEDTFYSIIARQHKDIGENWGARNLVITRASGFARWVSVIRDTATGYSYDDDSGKYGMDYLNSVRMYGDTQYKPTEYNWWWESTLSTLSNNYMYVKEDSRSLKIEYPTSSGVDTVSVIRSDSFGKDNNWEVKDSLSMWLYVDDINNLNTSFGDITFGYNDTVTEDVYYRWDISSLNLKSGWNKLQLRFDAFSSMYPYSDDYLYRGTLDKKLDFSNYDLNVFYIRYRGKGVPIVLYLTDIKVERSVFDSGMQFGAGLCLVGNDFLSVPVSNLTLERGAIEFWFKPYYDSAGNDAFGEYYSRTLFTIINNNNETVSLGIAAGSWFTVMAGHIRKGSNIISASSSLSLGGYFNINELIHIAVVWSNDGSGMSNEDTLRFYMRNTLIYSIKDTWNVTDTKSAFIKLAGGNTPLANLGNTTWGGGIFENLKIYNYCKTNFEINKQSNVNDITYDPNEFLQLSIDGSTFYSLGDTNLPFRFNQVPVDESRSVYIRSVKNDKFKHSKKTGELLVSWLTSV